MRTCLSLLASILALSACGPLAPASTAPAGLTGEPASRVAGGPKPGKLTTPGEIPGAAPVVANNGANLIGKVKVPATLISDKGLGYVTLANVEEAPLAGATVELLDAAGQPITRDGAPVTAITGPDGAYALTVDFKPNNWQLRVGLPQGRGQLAAIVPSTGAERREVEVDFVSTLTTTYILETYVKTQQDAQKTLDKLTPEVEAETRRKAEAALEAGQVPVPETLDPETVLATVEALRQQDAGFDAQMETVKRLLVVAGLANLGEGQKATEVFLSGLQGVFPASDGSLYLEAGPLWRITPQGLLERLPVTGEWSGTLSIDDQGRLWRGDKTDGRLRRREPDGTIVTVHDGTPPIKNYALTSGDGFVFTTWAEGASTAELWASEGAGSQPRRLAVFSGQEATYLKGARTLAADPQGRVSFIYAYPAPYLYRVGAAGGLTLVMKYGDGIGNMQLDARGNIHYQRDSSVLMRTPDGDDRVITGLTGLRFLQYSAIPPGPDGTYYLLGNTTPGSSSAFRSLYRLENGQQVLVAGKERQAVLEGGDPTQLSLQGPIGLAANQKGEVFISDAESLLKVHPTEGVSTVIAVDAVPGRKPGQLVVAPDDSLYIKMVAKLSSLSDPDPIYRLVPGQAPVLVYTPENGGRISDWMVTPDGSLYVSESRNVGISEFYGQLRRRSPDGTITTLIPESEDYFIWYGMGLDGQGRLWLAANRKGGGSLSGKRYYRWTDAGLEAAPEVPFFPQTLDAQGRWIASLRASSETTDMTIKRFDPVSQAVEVLVGPGGKLQEESGTAGRYVLPCFDGAGNLLFVDQDAKQIKRLSADAL